jgi:hypothetical protein
MSAYHEFLTELFDHGRVVFRSPPGPVSRPTPRAMAVLREAFVVHQLPLVGPVIAFDEETAGAAAELLRQAAWASVCRDERVAGLERRLAMPRSPRTPSEHLSADLCLRYLPQVARRARGLDSGDPMVGLLHAILSRWPLSGVLADTGDAPHGSLDFGGHPGLMLLYAERLLGNDRPNWRPKPGERVWAHYELARSEYGIVEDVGQADLPVG